MVQIHSAGRSFQGQNRTAHRLTCPLFAPGANLLSPDPSGKWMTRPMGLSSNGRLRLRLARMELFDCNRPLIAPVHPP